MAAATRTIYVAVIGTGTVGTPFLSQLSNLSSKLSPLGTTLSLLLVARSSSHAGLDASYTPLSLPFTSSQLKSEAPPSPEKIIEYLSNAPHPTILVDNTAGDTWASQYPKALASGISVVTPNKKGFSSDYKLWQSIFAAAANETFGQERSVEKGKRRGYVFHESTVGAGLPVLSTVKELLETGDKVTKVEGVFSGTMSYLFNTWNASPAVAGQGEQLKFSDVVSKAKSLGYTEPDPRDDLNGVDVARKAVILARLCGLKIESVQSFPVQSLVPKDLSSPDISASTFMEKLPTSIDSEMDKIKLEAGKEGKVVRFVGSVDVAKGEVKVGLEKFGTESAIAGLKGSDNVFAIYTERYGSNPLVVQGAGAGGEVTAMGVTGDVVKIIKTL